MAKSFLQEVLAFLPSRIPHCSHLLLMKSFSNMEDPGNVLEVLEPAPMNAFNVDQATLESVIKFLQDEILDPLQDAFLRRGSERSVLGHVD